MGVAKLATITWLYLSLAGCTRAQKPTEQPAAEPAAALESVPEPIDWSAFDSTSLRNPNDGSLRGGVPLPLLAPGLRFNPGRDPGARYGTVEVVRTLVDAAARVHRELGGLPVTINDLSLELGGPIPHHRSHQSGRDVDVLFYQLGPGGEPIESVGAFFDPSGAGVDFRDLADPEDDVPLTLDVPRTWLFLRALIENEAAQIQNIYVAEHLRTLLLAHARSTDAPTPTLERFEAVTCQPSYPHDDHFHFRFFCTADDIAQGCRDSRPIYPWQRERLRAAGARPRPLAPKREEAESKIVTHEEAREAAGPMDPEVERWLDRRMRWIEKPHPGRPYCP
jgi:penicillin-insensitive murein endopeptidase